MSDRIDLLERIEKLEKALDNAVQFVNAFIPYACPYEIDEVDWEVNWPRCNECGTLCGQQRECWKEYFKNG